MVIGQGVYHLPDGFHVTPHWQDKHHAFEYVFLCRVVHCLRRFKEGVYDYLDYRSVVIFTRGRQQLNLNGALRRATDKNVVKG